MSNNSLFISAVVLGSWFIVHGACAQDEFVYDAKGKRNPFIPLVTSEGRLLKLDKQEARGDLTVEGIIFDKEGRSFAIVNGAVVGIGDNVDAYRILTIEASRVTFIREGQITEVEINKEGE